MREAGSSCKMMSSQVPRKRAKKTLKMPHSRALKRLTNLMKTQHSPMKMRKRMMAILMISLALAADLAMKGWTGTRWRNGLMKRTREMLSGDKRTEIANVEPHLVNQKAEDEMTCDFSVIKAYCKELFK
tara:strand:- start:105 stop:491 length:387 start_codon:yes stop_codon:yes gene_type:complete